MSESLSTDPRAFTAFPSYESWCRLRGLMPPDRELYESQKAFAATHATCTTCVACKEGFSDANCFTQAGWQETQISGMCERCFDAVCGEVEPVDEHEADTWDHSYEYEP